MHLIKYIVLLCCVFVIGCSKDDSVKPVDASVDCSEAFVQLDTIFLHPESLEFIPYDGTESIYFHNVDSEEVRFEPLYPPISHVFRPNDFLIICIDGDTTSYAFTREQYAVSHRCIDLDLQYYLNIYVHNSAIYPRFVDKFSLLFHKPPTNNLIDTLISLNMITSYKENTELLSAEFDSYNNYEFLSEIQLLNQTFYDVFRVIEPEYNLLTELYFTRAQGIIGFRDLDQRLWVFDRIE